ncbi:MAG: hypothetical protein K0S47_1881 [Herbinix sp.]|jgi:dephospho-CoA kinase|nr:hypothetical protein [Herbinix sp.]
MKVIGITGGIGSGKSMVTNILEDQHGAYILNTDQIARDQMEIGGSSYEGVVSYFGKIILNEDGSINRPSLAKIVFEDKKKLKILNELTHPNVLEVVKDEIERFRNSTLVSYLVIETALMIESGYDIVCDEVWYVYASEEDRRERLKVNRNYSDEKIDAIFFSQRSDQEFRKKFSKIIENTGNKAYVEEQVKRLLVLL